MTCVESVAVLGAGAMGAVYASKFFDVDSSCVYLVASGERYDRLRRDGLVVNGAHYAIPVRAPDEASAPADLIIVALKHHHLLGAVHDLRNSVGEQTAILSVMNGLDSEAIIGSVYGMDKMLYCIAIAIDAQRSGNVIGYSTVGTLHFGEADNTHLSERVLRIQTLFDRAGIAYTTPQDMIRSIWWKFMINVGINQASAVLRAPYGVFQTSPDAQMIMESAMWEVIAIAEAARVNLVEKDIADWYTFLNTLHPEGRTSMLQDIEAGRRTEVDAFGAKVVELGRIYGVPTPVNETLLHAIRYLSADAAHRPPATVLD